MFDKVELAAPEQVSKETKLAHQILAFLATLNGAEDISLHSGAYSADKAEVGQRPALIVTGPDFNTALKNRDALEAARAMLTEGVLTELKYACERLPVRPQTTPPEFAAPTAA